MRKNMKKRIKAYRRYMDELLERLEGQEERNGAQIEEWKKEHLVQIGFFQHERLIHLIVTAVFALLEIFSMLLAVISQGIFSLLLTVAVLILLVPYIRHYYILENEVQKMYGQYDRLCRLS